MSAHNPPRSRASSAVLSFIGMSAVAGVLVAAATTPAVVVASLTAGSTISIFGSLPDYLEIGHLSQRSTIFAKGENGGDVPIAQFYAQNREEVSLDKISIFAREAALAGEDKDFYHHGGFDIMGTFRAALATALGQSTQGGSGITQQYVKNVLVEKAAAIPNQEERKAKYAEATAFSFDRKLKELKYAIGVEKKYSKDEILAGYLNIAYFGANVYGIQAAARYYFNVLAADLTIAQSATLLSMVNNPDVLRIDRPNNPENGAANGYARTSDRKNHIVGLMLRNDKITQAQHDEARDAPIVPAITPMTNGCDAAKGAEYFCQYVKNVFKNDEAYGSDPDERYENFRRGGYEIYTTLDLRLQQTALHEINRIVPKVFEGRDLAGTSVAVEVGTGRILMMVQSKDFTEDPDVAKAGRNYTSLNYNADEDYGGSSGFQPGSTYKIFTLAEWVSTGHTVSEPVNGARRNWSPMNDRCSGPFTEPYNPVNDDGSGGGMSNAKIATEQSVNSTYMAMAKQLDLCNIKERAEKFFAHRADRDPLFHGASSVLGVNEVAPLTIVTAMAGFANGGKTCSPVAIDRVLRPDKSEAPTPKTKCVQSIEPSAAAEANIALAGVMTNGTGRRSMPSGGTPMIGKSGTSDNNYDSWMTVASTRMAVSSWVGNVAAYDGSKTNMRRYSFSGTNADQTRHLYTKPILEVANRLYPGGAFPLASAAQSSVDHMIVPDLRGTSAASAELTLSGFGFEPVKGSTLDDAAPADTVVRTDPPAGGSAPKGSRVTYF